MRLGEPPWGNGPLASWLPIGCVLETVDNRLGPVSVRTHSCDPPFDVVCRPAKTYLSVVVHRPSGTRIAVERRTDTAGVYEQCSVRPRSTKLQVAVSEQDRSLRLAGEHPFFSLLWLGSEALDVGERGPMADQDALELSLLRKPVQPVDEIGAERFARSRQGGPEKPVRALGPLGIVA